MPDARTLDIYLDDQLRASAMAGQHNYMNRIRDAFEGEGFTVSFLADGVLPRLTAHRRPGHALFHMQEPPHDRALTTRRAYFYPFWRIESTNRRWEWEVARTPFDPDTVDPQEAARFVRFWRKRLFGDAADQPGRDGFLYAPLQGRLLEHRSFQTMSPLDMLRATLESVPNKPIHVTLHPNETYTQAERSALSALAESNPRLRIVQGPAEPLLAACDGVVTQNSSTALSGFFFGKPAALFAAIDFHHIAANVETLGVDEAFRQMQGDAPEFDRYLFWFLQIMSINAGKPDAPAQILKTVRRRGWDI